MQDSEQDTRTIFVGNLSEKVTDEILYELFLQVSKNWNATILRLTLIILRLDQWNEFPFQKTGILGS